METVVWRTDIRSIRKFDANIAFGAKCHWFFLFDLFTKECVYFQRETLKKKSELFYKTTDTGLHPFIPHCPKLNPLQLYTFSKQKPGTEQNVQSFRPDLYIYIFYTVMYLNTIWTKPAMQVLTGFLHPYLQKEEHFIVVTAFRSCYSCIFLLSCRFYYSFINLRLP